MAVFSNVVPKPSRADTPVVTALIPIEYLTWSIKSG